MTALALLITCSLAAAAATGTNPCGCPHPLGRLGCTRRKLTTAVDDKATGSAATKQEAVWAKLMADRRSKGFMNPLETLYHASHKNELEEMGSEAYGDRRPGHVKMTHGIAGHAKAHFEWLPNRFSGMFQPGQADHCLIRIANAAEPSKSWLNPTSYNPNMAVKCFRNGDGVVSSNLQTIWEIDGYNDIPEGTQGSCSMFETPLSNHCGRRDNVSRVLRNTFVADFDAVSNESMMLGVSQMAVADQNGTRPSNVDFPFALVFVPNPLLNTVPCDFANVTSQLLQIEERIGHVLLPTAGARQEMFTVFAIAEPWYSRPRGVPDVVKMGSMMLDSGFTTAIFGDTELFFRHTFWEQELELLRNASRAQAWSKYAVEWRKEEGAAWYWPFL